MCCIDSGETHSIESQCEEEEGFEPVKSQKAELSGSVRHVKKFGEGYAQE